MRPRPAHARALCWRGAVAGALLALGACGGDEVGRPERPTRDGATAAAPDVTDDPDETEVPTEVHVATLRPRRVLLVVADDISAASTNMYADTYPEAEGQTVPMPTVEALCDGGVRFSQAWATPSCAPTRASMITGQFPFRLAEGDPEAPLAADAVTMPQRLKAHDPDLALAHIGKWHLGRAEETGGDATPNTFGWTHFAGGLDATLPDYFAWERTEDGVTAEVNTYASTQNVDDSIAWLEGLDEDAPWVMWLAFNAPHAPFHLPPVELHDFDELAGEEVPSNLASAEELLPWFQASAQAMDSELGRLLQWLDEHDQGDVDVIFLGDNGTPPEVVQEPLDRTRGKGTVFQGGVQVPLCISGPSVAQPGRVEPRPVATVDILSTVLDLAGVPADELPGSDEVDSQSLGPVLRDPAAELTRDWTFVEGYAELSRYGSTHALVQDGLKLVRYEDYDEVELYDLASDPLELVDLLGQPTFDERRDAELEAASDDKGRPGNDDDDDGDHDGHHDDDGSADTDDSDWAEATADLGSLLDALLSSGR